MIANAVEIQHLRILQVGHILRYDPATDFIRGVMTRGELGDIRWIQGRFSGFKRPRADCGVTAAFSVAPA